MDYIYVVTTLKKLLKLSDNQIAKDAGLNRAYINYMVHGKVLPTKKTKIAVTYALCNRVESEILMHKNQIDLLERLMNELKAAV